MKKLSVADFKSNLDNFYYIVRHEDLFSLKTNKWNLGIILDNCNDDLKQLIAGFNLKTNKEAGEVIEKYINLTFEQLFLFSHENNIFFNECSFTVYELTFENRFLEYKNIYVDTTLYDFIVLEQSNLIPNLIESFFVSLDDTNDKRISDSKKKKYDFLMEKIISNEKLQQHEPEAIDLSDTTATEKIIYLQKLGVIDFLTNKNHVSINGLATVLSAITGEKAGTIQPMLNPMISKQAGQRNNPLNSKNTVSKVEKQLINIGFNLNETI